MKFLVYSFMPKYYRMYLWLVLGFCLALCFSARVAYLYFQAIDLKDTRDHLYLEWARLKTIKPSLNEYNKQEQEAHLAFLEKCLNAYRPKYTRAAYKAVKNELSALTITESLELLRVSLEEVGISVSPEATFSLEGLATERNLRGLQEEAFSYLWACFLKVRPSSFLGLKTYTEKGMEHVLCLCREGSTEKAFLIENVMLYCRIDFLGYSESLRVLVELLNTGPYTYVIDKISAKAREATIARHDGFCEYIPGEVEFSLWVAVVKNQWGEVLES